MKDQGQMQGDVEDQGPRRSGGGSPRPASPREYERLWASLAGREWSSLVIVPAGKSGSALEVANSLAAVGRRLAGVLVTAITVSRLDDPSARSVTELQELSRRYRGERAVHARPSPVPVATILSGVRAPRGQSPAVDIADEFRLSPGARLVIAIPPVLDEPLGVDVARHADVVVVSIQMGRTLAYDVSRTIALIGRDRILGCLTMVPA